jgi:MFS family permease
MVQLSGVVATVVTLVAGTLSDRIGSRRKFISIGYIIWGFTVAIFGFISPELFEKLFSLDSARAAAVGIVVIIAGDCVMTLFGSTANDAAFNAWVTDNTDNENRTKIEGVLSTFPLVAMLIVAGGFGIIASITGYSLLFLGLGIVISASGVIGLFVVKDSPDLRPSGSMKDIFYGFSPKRVVENKPFYVCLLIVVIYGIACQIFLPYMIIYMREYLGFTDIEYSVVFGGAIALGAVINILVTRIAERFNKITLYYVAASVMAAGLLAMYFSKGMGKTLDLVCFGIAGLVMITGYILVAALTGSTLRDYTPDGVAGKLQGVRMVFSVLIPMLIGPFIGNSINKAMNIPMKETAGADLMTTSYVPAPEIFLAAAICSAIMLALIPLLSHFTKKRDK